MKDYKKILEGLVNIINNTEKSDIGFANICTFIGENCPELKEYEDERIRKEILDYIDKATGCKRWVAWLEKQGEQKSFDYENANIPQKDSTWSEEDESNFQGIIDELKANKHQAPDSDLPTYDRFLSWFKSLKNRYGWKPSDEQIKALEHFVRSIGESGFASPYDDNTRLLYSLLEQLKKNILPK